MIDPNQLWGKKAVTNSRQLWLPLRAHLEETRKMMVFLYDRYLNDAQRKLLNAGFEGEDEVIRMLKFLGFEHDLGKATPAFQSKSSRMKDGIHHELDMKIKEKNPILMTFNGSCTGETPHNLASEALLEYNGVNPYVGAIIGGHHGKPFPTRQKKDIKNHTSNYWQTDSESEQQKEWKEVQDRIFHEGLKKAGYSSADEIPDIVNQPQAVLYEGLLIMADWLASSEYLDNHGKIPMFPLIGLNQGMEDIDSNERFENAVKVMGMDRNHLTEKIARYQDIYQKRWGFQPRSVQKVISGETEKIANPGITIIEAPMGIGKTETALVTAEQFLHRTKRTGLYIGLPTQVTTNAMFGRVRKWLDSYAQEQGGTRNIELLHGKAAFNEEYRKLFPHAGNISDESDDNGNVVVNEWFSGKKSILGDFIVGTIDNLLLTGLKQKHLFLHHLGFSGKVVVIDEVHAYDTYMNRYLYRTLQWLGAYHVPVIVLSATLPTSRRGKLIEKYMDGFLGGKNIRSNADWKSETAYPLLTFTDGAELHQVTDFGKPKEGKSVQIIKRNFSNEELLSDITDRLSEGGIAGIIVNTVRKAQELAKSMKSHGNIPVTVLHSRFIDPERADRERELQQKIGKNAVRPEKMIVIGTQVLEQSLDIDFDILYTDIAPMDLILQRTGRMHRHDIKRPHKLTHPVTYIMGINDFGDYGRNNEAIYSKYLLGKTDYFIPDTIKIPDDISILVQKTYTDRNNDEVEEFNEWHADFQTNCDRERRKAEGYQIESPPARPATIHGWLDRDKGNIDSDEKAAACVRDIKKTLEVVLLRRKDGQVCLIDGTPLMETTSREIARQTVRLPRAVTPDLESNRDFSSITSLEEDTSLEFPDWKADKWLHSSLAIILDHEMKAELNGYILQYSHDYGLSYRKENDNEQHL